MGWQDRVREQSRFKKIMTVVVIVAATASLYVNLRFSDHSRERMLVQLVWAASMLVWSLAMAFDLAARRRTGRDAFEGHKS